MVTVGSALPIIPRRMRITGAAGWGGTVVYVWQIWSSTECDRVHILPHRKFNGGMLDQLAVKVITLTGMVGAKEPD